MKCSNYVSASDQLIVIVSQYVQCCIMFDLQHVQPRKSRRLEKARGSREWRLARSRSIRHASLSHSYLANPAATATSTSPLDTLSSIHIDGGAISAGRSPQGLCSYGAAPVRHPLKLLSRPQQFATMALSSSPLPNEHAYVVMLIKNAVEFKRSE
jgi:hypothetical protein